MPRLGLALVGIWLRALLVFRTLLQWWRTGSGGPGGSLFSRFGPAHPLAAGLVASGIAGALSAQLTLGDSWRIGVGEGERTELVTRGVFAWSRNPIFSCILVSGAGLFGVVPNLWSALVFVLTLAPGKAAGTGRSDVAS